MVAICHLARKDRSKIPNRPSSPGSSFRNTATLWWFAEEQWQAFLHIYLKNLLLVPSIEATVAIDWRYLPHTTYSLWQSNKDHGTPLWTRMPAFAWLLNSQTFVWKIARMLIRLTSVWRITGTAIYGRWGIFRCHLLSSGAKNMFPKLWWQHWRCLDSTVSGGENLHCFSFFMMEIFIRQRRLSTLSVNLVLLFFT